MHEDGLFAWDCARILVGNPTAQLWVMGDALISDRGLADRRGQLSHKKNFEVPLINRCDNGGRGIWGEPLPAVMAAGET